MVKTSYPAMWRYINKWSVIVYGLAFFVPIQYTVHMGHFSWKRGKVPRLCHNDQRVQKWVGNAGARQKLMYTQAIEWQQDQNNFMAKKYLGKFFKKHRDD